MRIVAPLFCGLIFGAGLLISGMVQPAKVLGFLDIFGAWDPSLAVVMAAALAVSVPGFRLAGRRAAVVCQAIFSAGQIGNRFAAGGRRGACSESDGGLLALPGAGAGEPGYAVARRVIVFVAAMAAGMLAARCLANSRG